MKENCLMEIDWGRNISLIDPPPLQKMLKLYNTKC